MVLFDPLRYLRDELHAVATLGPTGEVLLRFDGPVIERQRQKAQAVAWDYERLIKLQMENGGASVQKLIAWGKIRVVEGRYVLGQSAAGTG